MFSNWAFDQDGRAIVSLTACAAVPYYGAVETRCVTMESFCDSAGDLRATDSSPLGRRMAAERLKHFKKFSSMVGVIWVTFASPSNRRCPVLVLPDCLSLANCLGIAHQDFGDVLDSTMPQLRCLDSRIPRGFPLCQRINRGGISRSISGA